MVDRRLLLNLILLSAGLLLAAAPVHAQVGSGGLTGLVTDPAGTPLPGVAITIVNAATTRTRLVHSGLDGRYVVGGLSPGPYELKAALDGFRPLMRDGIRIATGDTVRLDLRLDVGAAEAVRVTDDAPLLRAEASGLGQGISSQAMVALPLNGRSFIVLAGLAPGVALPPGSLLPRINGGRPRTND